MPRSRAQLGLYRMQEGLNLAVFLQERRNQFLIYLQVYLPGCQLKVQGPKRQKEVLEGEKIEEID
jgi:hypothetical protein